MNVLKCICWLPSVMLMATSAWGDILVPAKIEEQSPREDLRKRVFSESLKQRECKILSKNPGGTVDADSSLTAALQTLLKGLNSSDAKVLLPLFHPQLKVKPAQVAVALTSISRISGGQSEATLFRVYGLNNPSGETDGIVCTEDGLMLYPLYGHPLQAGVWVQVQGRDEVARVFAILIPTKDKWQIGAWHVQQWTHAGKDFAQWRAQGQELSSKKENVAAWVYYDLAEKLLDGGKFMAFPVAKDVVAEQAPLLAGKSLQETLNKKLSSDKVVYASSLFSRKGASILIRFGIEAEWSANAIKEHCRARFKQLSAEPWMQSIAGIRCDYVTPRESPTKEGALGGIFVDQTTVGVR